MAVMPLSPDPGKLYGRDQQLGFLQALIAKPLDAVQAVLLVGEGGTGKTYLIQKLIETPDQSKLQLAYVPLYDFYHIDKFKASAIETAIISALAARTGDKLEQPALSYFGAYLEQRDRVDRSRQSGARFQTEQDKLRATFIVCFNTFAAAQRAVGRPVLLLFDTAEQAVDLNDGAAKVLLEGHTEAGWGGENWLCRMLPELKNTLAILSGRALTLYDKPVEFYKRLAKAIEKVAGTGAWHELEIAGIDYPDALAFAKGLKDFLIDPQKEPIEAIRGLADAVQLEDEAKMRMWFEIADGLPFWISMLFTREMLGIVPEGSDPIDELHQQLRDRPTTRLAVGERTELRDAVMRQVLLSTVPNNSAPLTLALQWMATTRKGLSREILRALLTQVPLAIDAEALFDQIGQLLIVKQRTVPRYTHGGDELEETLLFLHDEIYLWLGRTDLPTDTNQLMIDWYTAAIDAAERERLVAVDALLELPYDAPPPSEPPPLDGEAPVASARHDTDDPLRRESMRRRDDAVRRKQQLILDRLGYYFQLSTERGVQEYNVLAYAAIRNRDYGFNITIRQEGLRNMYRAMGRIPLAIEIECAARWLLRAVYADEAWIETLLSRVQHYYRYEAEHPGLPFALLRLAEVQARLNINPSEDRARTQALLAEALQIVEAHKARYSADRWCRFVQAELLNCRGLENRHFYELPEAAKAYREGLAIHNRYTDLLPVEFKANILNNLAYAYSEQGEVDDARTFALQALELRQRFGSEFNVGLSFNTLARIEIRIGNGSKALGYAARAYAIFQGQDATRGLVLCLPVLANAWRKVAEESYDPGVQRRDLQRSLNWFAYTEKLFGQREIKSAERWRELYQQWGCAHRSWAQVLARRGLHGAEARAAFAAAHQTMEQALDVAQKAPLPRLMELEIHEDMAVIHINQDEYDHRIEEHVDAAERCAPDEYRIREGAGLPEVAEPTRAYWRCLGQCQLQRMMLSFGKYDFGFFSWPENTNHQATVPRQQLEAPRQPKFLVEVARHMLLMEAYLLKYSGSSWMLGKAEQLALRELKLGRSSDELDTVELALLQTARQFNLLNSDALVHALSLLSRAKRDLPLSGNE